jgi:methionyl-tRNA synthetase
MAKNYYVTTSIAYVNAEPHIGYAMELVMADVLARAARKQGMPVIYATGTDEHGSKIAEKAAELKMTPKALADKVSVTFKDLQKLLNISNDRFVRTTDPSHEQRAQIIWKQLAKDIYKGKYVGLYCMGCEEFVTEAVAKANKGICPHHDKPYEKLEEENYFFKLSTYTDQVREQIEKDQLLIIPQTRKNEILQLLRDGLEDISISRPKEKLSWGIPVPGDKTQVMYVWFEALMNYLTVLGYPEHKDYKDYWPANVQVIGKDIIRFHAGVWPAMLLGINAPLPRAIYTHGFLTIDGKKISKSVGNVVHPKEVVDRYNADTFRYYFLRHIPSYGDGDFSWERLEEVYNNELANELGNAVQRTAAMITQYQNGIIGQIPPATHDVTSYWEALNFCRFDKALEEVWERIRGLNQYIDEEKPWVIAKEGDEEHLREVLAYQCSALLQIAELLEPFMPETALKIRHVFEEGVVRPIEQTLFPKHVATGSQPKAS